MANNKGKDHATEVYAISSDDENKGKSSNEPISVSSEVEPQAEQEAGAQATGTVKTDKIKIRKSSKSLENIENVDQTRKTKTVVVVCRVVHETLLTNDDDCHHNNDNNNKLRSPRRTTRFAALSPRNHMMAMTRTEWERLTSLTMRVAQEALTKTIQI